MKQRKLSVLIPVYNEKNTLLQLLHTVENADTKDVKKEIVIVDDCSTDGTRDILKKLSKKYKVYYHKKNQGKGAAIKTAIKHATGDIIIIQDADLEYDPNEYYSLIRPILENKTSVVYGSRRLDRSNKQYSGLSFFVGGVGLTYLANFLYPGLRITDEPTCYKVFRADVLKDMNLECRRFEFCPEVTAKVAKKGIKIHEVPIKYVPRHTSEGKKIKWKDGVEAVWTLVKYRFRD